MASELIHKARKFSRLLFKKRVSFPREIQLEITNRCNLDCDMCPRLSLLKVPEIDMSQETFHKVLDSLVKPRAITLTGWGEPLMHGDFFNFVDEIHSRFPSCQLAFTTNGFLLNEATVRKILLRPFTRVTFSLEELPWEEGSLALANARAEGLDPKKGH
ncbi:MAG: radical SAM protein, partial [Planctomycetota bacterium]|nr:radical SAM protein [Planctomycetota bacterium]